MAAFLTWLLLVLQSRIKSVQAVPDRPELDRQLLVALRCRPWISAG
ncbi:MAG: hypothetical protein WA005_12970 [Candidatus Binataceae bacterium]